MITKHNIYIGASQRMMQVNNNSVDLVVTSPPYPMIKMWDNIFAEQNTEIAKALDTDRTKAFRLMHNELDNVWKECFRVLKYGGFMCINIGDATRNINNHFSLYNNHSHVIQSCLDIGFIGLPNIIWRKQTNAPNKFMGSGMLPCGAYVTLEHEWILIFRKGDKREFKTEEQKLERMKSAYFWEERNAWFSDVWDVKGAKQNLQAPNTRERSAAYPFEIPYRLINMFSLQGDTVLDPFLGTGTTMQAAIATGRNSIGFEIDENFKPIIKENIKNFTVEKINQLIDTRLEKHREFVKNRNFEGKDLKHYNKNLKCAVMTKQEKEIEFHKVKSIKEDVKDNDMFVVEF